MKGRTQLSSRSPRSLRPLARRRKSTRASPTSANHSSPCEDGERKSQAALSGRPPSRRLNSGPSHTVTDGLKECVAMDIPHELRDEFPQEISLIERMIRTNDEFRRLAAPIFQADFPILRNFRTE